MIVFSCLKSRHAWEHHFEGQITYHKDHLNESDLKINLSLKNQLLSYLGGSIQFYILKNNLLSHLTRIFLKGLFEFSLEKAQKLDGIPHTFRLQYSLSFMPGVVATYIQKFLELMNKNGIENACKDT